MWIRRQKFYNKPTKYHNKSCVCLQNHQHDSVIEANYCNQLEILRKMKEIKSYEIQVDFDLVVNGNKICGIRPDFVVTTLLGAKEVHEVKSYITMTKDWNIKRKLFEALFPEITYIVIN